MSESEYAGLLLRSFAEARRHLTAAALAATEPEYRDAVRAAVAAFGPDEFKPIIPGGNEYESISPIEDALGWLGERVWKNPEMDYYRRQVLVLQGLYYQCRDRDRLDQENGITFPLLEATKRDLEELVCEIARRSKVLERCLTLLGVQARPGPQDVTPAEPAAAQPTDPGDEAAELAVCLLKSFGIEESARVYAVAKDDGKTVDQRQREIYALYPIVLGWSGQQWADLLGVTDRACRGSDWWNGERRRLRGENEEGRKQKAKTGHGKR